MRELVTHGTFGIKGYRLAKVYKLGPKLYLVERWVRGRLRRKSFADLKAARVFAKTWYEKGLEPEAESLTLRELFDRYVTTNAEQRKWRPKTLLLRQAERKRIEEVLTPEFPVVQLNPSHLDKLWLELKKMGMAEGQIARRCQFLRHVAAWGHSRDYLPHSRLAAWSAPIVPKSQIAEYQPAEVAKLLTHLRRDPRGTRALAALLLAQSMGLRANALLHLRWEDVEEEWVVCRAEWDKTKKTWRAGLTADGREAFAIMRAYQTRRKIESPWVFHGKTPSRPYTYGALWIALQAAERAAGVKHLPHRALHGMRRHAVNEHREASGDLSLAMMAVGDKDLRQAVSYARPREKELLDLANRPSTVSASTTSERGAGKSLTDNGIPKPAMGLEPMTPSLDNVPGEGVSHIRQGVRTANRQKDTPEKGRNAVSNRTATVFRGAGFRPRLPHPPVVD